VCGSAAVRAAVCGTGHLVAVKDHLAAGPLGIATFVGFSQRDGILKIDRRFAETFVKWAARGEGLTPPRDLMGS
jgi:hypothetical protein